MLKKYSRKRIIFLIFSAFFIIGIVPATIYLTSSDAIVIKLNWDIEVPVGYHVIYETDSGSSFLGDGLRYHVFQYDTYPDINHLEEWKNDEIEEDSIKKILDKLKVEKKHYPDFNHVIAYRMTREDNSTINILFDPNFLKLYVIEDII